MNEEKITWKEFCTREKITCSRCELFNTKCAKNTALWDKQTTSSWKNESWGSSRCFTARADWGTGENKIEL